MREALGTDLRRMPGMSSYTRNVRQCLSYTTIPSSTRDPKHSSVSRRHRAFGPSRNTVYSLRVTLMHARYVLPCGTIDHIKDSMASYKKKPYLASHVSLR